MASQSMIKSYFFLIAFLIIAQISFSQDITEFNIDSLYKLDYDNLFIKLKKVRKDTILYRSYAKDYLEKAKEEKDLIKQSNGLYLLGLISNEYTAIKYADSIIDITSQVNNFVYPARGHLLKARNLGRLKKYQQALDELIKANNYAQKSGNTDQKYRVNYFIGVLKVSLGEFAEALDHYKSTTRYYEQKFENDYKYKKDYLKSMYALSNTYNRVKIHDSAYYFVKKGISLSLSSNDSIFYGYYLLSSGITNYYIKNYKSSLDSLIKFKKIYQYRITDGNISIADLYLGKIHYDNDQTDKALHFLEKVDSIPTAQLRSCYELLLKIYKKKNNAEKQVEYIDKILKTDSIIVTDSKYLYKNIERKYSTPILISEKEQIIKSLEKSRKHDKISILLLFIVILLISFILYYNVKKRKRYKQRFLELYNKNNTQVNSSNREFNNKKDTSNIEIPESTVNDILEKLEVFEKNTDFLKSGLTIAELSKVFETNSRYLSKIINVFKNKNFSSYINDLRIDYVVEELKNNHKFRKYTIKAIANDSGFNSTEIFSKLFYKKTGIYPSFYLKELEKKNKY